MTDRAALTVKQVAEMLDVRQHQILALISRGELPAVDVSLKANKRPRWRILRDDLDGFLLRRTHQAPAPRRRRRKRRPNVKQYF